jgi:hypothetical protein
MGCHPRYRLPITHHEVRENLGILNIRGRIGILCLCGRCRRLLELVNLSLEVVNLTVSVHELNLMLLQLLLTLL